MNTHVLFSATAYLENASVFRKYYETVSEERRAKIDRFRFDKDKRLSLCAEVLLSDALSLEGLRREDLPLCLSEYQKPDFLPETGCHFNLSHSEGAAMCILSASPCGCDIEAISEKHVALAERFFLPSEAGFILSGKCAGEQAERFTRIWVLKESFLKCTGLGFSLPPNAFEILLPTEDCPRIAVRQSVSKNTFRFTEYAPFAGYRAATCIEDTREMI